MDEALWCAAQPVTEESVAHLQSERITRQVYERSAVPMPTSPAPARKVRRGSTILWPYPRGSADVIDRANCADLFLRTHSEFRVVTEDGIGHGALARAGAAESLLLFCPFDAVLP